MDYIYNNTIEFNSSSPVSLGTGLDEYNYPPHWFDESEHRLRLGVEEILEGTKPVPTDSQLVEREGKERNGQNIWVKKWKLVNKFATQAETDIYLAGLLEDRRNAKLKEIDAKRREVQKLGFNYQFPDGLFGIIQTRDQTEDLTNVTAQTLAAIVLQGQGVSDPVLSFRDTQNVTHPLNPLQTIMMGMAVSQFINNIYAAKWGHDEAIKVWDGISPYDIDSGWNV